MYAQKKVKTQLSEDRPPPAGSRPRKSIRTQQPEFSTITTQLSLCDGPIHRLVLFEPRLALNRTVVLKFRLNLESLELAAGIRRVKGVKHLGQRSGTWLNIDQVRLLVDKSDGDGLRNKRDFAMISILLGCGLRRAELAALNIDDIQIRQGHWAYAY